MDTNVAIVTCAFTNDPRQWECLRESAKHCNVTLNVNGEGRGYPEMVGLFSELIPLVEAMSQEYILLTDAYDVLMNRWDEDEVIELVEASIGGLVFSCESNCWPSGPWCGHYGPPETPWWYPNGGQYVGRKEMMIGLWKEFLSGRWPVTQGGSTQEIIHRTGLGYDPHSRDTECRIFQSMTGEAAKNVTVHQNAAWNTTTGYPPMFLHWNGRAGGMLEMYTELWGAL